MFPDVLLLLLVKEGDPFQGLRVGFCLTLGNELSEETHMLTKQETLLERAAQAERLGKGTQEDCSTTRSQSQVLWDGVSVRTVSSQSF